MGVRVTVPRARAPWLLSSAPTSGLEPRLLTSSISDRNVLSCAASDERWPQAGRISDFGGSPPPRPRYLCAFTRTDARSGRASSGLHRHLLLCAVGLLTHRAGTCDFGPVARDRAAGQETRRAKWRCSGSRGRACHRFRAAGRRACRAGFPGAYDVAAAPSGSRFRRLAAVTSTSPPRLARVSQTHSSKASTTVGSNWRPASSTIVWSASCTGRAVR